MHDFLIGRRLFHNCTHKSTHVLEGNDEIPVKVGEEHPMQNKKYKINDVPAQSNTIKVLLIHIPLYW